MKYAAVRKVALFLVFRWIRTVACPAVAEYAYFITHKLCICTILIFAVGECTYGIIVSTQNDTESFLESLKGHCFKKTACGWTTGPSTNKKYFFVSSRKNPFFGQDSGLVFQIRIPRQIRLYIRNKFRGLGFLLDLNVINIFHHLLV